MPRSSPPSPSEPETLPGCEPPEGARVLRRTAGRTVWSERREAGPVVVKAIARRGLLGRHRAARRVRREQRVAAALHGAGLPVPRALGAEARGAAWCSVQSRVRAARTLESWLARPTPDWPLSPTRLARDLGRLLAALQRAGLAQPDWHPGNLLLDRAGRWHAIDFQLARLARPDLARGRAELARLAGAVAHRVDPTLLRILHRAWRRGRGEAVGTPLQEVAFLAAARESRARIVERHLDRWTRSSGRIELQGGNLVRRGERDLVHAAASGLGPCLARLRRDRLVEVGVDGRALVAVRAAPRTIRSLWAEAARLFEHELPGLSPLSRSRRAPAWALFERRVPGSSNAGRTVDPSTALEAALARMDQRGLAWRVPPPERPDWWPLALEPGQPSEGSEASFRLTRTKSRMRGISWS